MAIIAVLNSLVTADTQLFEKGMDKAAMSAKMLENTVQQSSGKMSAALTTLGAVSGLGGFFSGYVGQASLALSNLTTVVSGFMSNMRSSSAASAAETGGVFARMVSAIGTGSLVMAGVLAAGAAAVIGFGFTLNSIASHGAETITTLRGLSQQIGISVDALSGLQAVGGFDIEGSARSMIHMQRAIADGSGEAGQALARLGLEMGALREASPLAQLEAIYGGFGRLTTQGERASTAMALFGRQGLSMIESLSKGSAGLEAGRQRAQDYGLTFTSAQADMVKSANKEWKGFGLAMKGIGIQAAGMFAPLWESMGKIGSTVGKWLVGTFRESIPMLQSAAAAGWEFAKSLFSVLPIGRLFSALWAYWSAVIGIFRAAIPYAKMFFDVVGAVAVAFGQVGDVVWGAVWGAIKTVAVAVADFLGLDRVTAWFSEMTGGWAGIKDAAMGTMATVLVLAKNWQDTFVSGIDLVKLAWLEFQRSIGVSGLDAEINRLTAALGRFNAAIGLQVRSQMQQWERELEGIGRAVAPVEQGGTPGGRGDQKAITGHEAAMRGSEREYSILNASGATQESLLKLANAINQRQLDINQRQLAEMQRAPRIRAVRR